MVEVEVSVEVHVGSHFLNVGMMYMGIQLDVQPPRVFKDHAIVKSLHLILGHLLQGCNFLISSVELIEAVIIRDNGPASGDLITQLKVFLFKGFNQGSFRELNLLISQILDLVLPRIQKKGVDPLYQGIGALDIGLNDEAAMQDVSGNSSVALHYVP